MPSPDFEFLYVADPMCSWCWGFSPVIRELDAHFDIPVRVLPGGLRPGPEAQLLDDGMRGYLTHHWEQVAARSGQPFDPKGLDRQGWVYDTELPCTALSTMNTLNAAETLPWLAALQQAFYRDAVDITDVELYTDLVGAFEVDTERFVSLLTSSEMGIKVWEDIEHSRSLGVNGFPTLLLKMPDQFAVVTRGYVPWDSLQPALSRFFESELGPEGAAELVAT